MLINKNDNMNSHVKFISYTGEYPNLCNGILTLEIDGAIYTFGLSWKESKPDFKRFWCSGGNVIADKHWNFDVKQNEWVIDVNELPEQFRKYATEIDEVFNENIDWGCCGGCI